jgi:hypothetical protein
MTITQFETRWTQDYAIGQEELRRREYEALRNVAGDVYKRLAHLDPGLAYGLPRRERRPADDYKRKGG